MNTMTFGEWWAFRTTLTICLDDRSTEWSATARHHTVREVCRAPHSPALPEDVIARRRAVDQWTRSEVLAIERAASAAAPI
jgi:hypothetical protein